MHVHAGECIKIDVPELALADQKVIVRRTTVNHQSASVTLECRSESDAKHPWALGQAAQPAPSPALSAVDPRYVPPPASADWTVDPKPPTSGGISQPIFTITVPIETADIVGVIIKHGPSASGPWTRGYEGAPSADGRYEIAGLTPGQSYCLSLQYVAKNGATSDPSIKCGNIAGELTAGNVIPTAPVVVAMQDAIDLADAAINDPTTGLKARTDALWTDVKTSGTGLLARMLAAETAETTNNSAAVARLSGLEASVNTAGTGLLARATSLEGRMGAVESGKASVTQVSQLEAVVRTNPNLLVNGGFELDSGSGWNGAGVLNYARNPDLGGSVMHAASTSARCYPSTPGANVWSGFAAAMSAQAVYQITSSEYAQACVVHYSDDAMLTSIGQTAWTDIIPDGTVRVFKAENYAKPAAARRSRVVFSIGASSRIVLRGGAKIEAGPLATAYTADASSKEFSVKQTEISSVATEANGRSKAIKGVIQDVNGYVSGFASTNDGTTSMFEIRADAFAVRDPSPTGERFEIQGKRIRAWYSNGQQAYQLG